MQNSVQTVDKAFMVAIATGQNEQDDSEHLETDRLISSRSLPGSRSTNDGWAVLESECAFKDPIVCAKEGAVFIQEAIVPVAKSAFDDFAGSGMKKKGIQKMLGFNS